MNVRLDNSVNTDFERPEHYIRHIEPIESELATQVEYDMDEQGSHSAFPFIFLPHTRYS
jgi:hypothetical protein